jgi:hypothetical protein
VGDQSHPAELSQQPEASLACVRATARTKRRQPRRRPCIEPRNCHHSWEPPLSKQAWAASVPRNGLRTSILPGSETMANVYEGTPGTWESCSSPSAHSARECRTRNFQAPGFASGIGGSEAPDASGGIAGRLSKHGETDEQASERSQSTVEAGERLSTGPREGKGSVESSTRWRETWRRLRTPIPCQRDNNG